MFLYYGIIPASIFVLGTVFGSFLNVVIYRTGNTGYSGRSRCLSCGKVLTPWMLIPILSFLIQRGRCGHCGAKFSWQYPLVEATTGVLFLLVWWVTRFDPLVPSFQGVVLFVLSAAIWMILLAIVIYDLRHKIIPDRFVFTFALFAGVLLVLKLYWGFLPSRFIPLLGDYTTPTFDFLAAPLLALPFALLWFFSGGRAMGLGDAKLAWGIGWLLGFSGGVSAVILAFWTAFFPSIALLLLPKKRFTMKSEIPFAPFLILGALLVFVWGIDILAWSL